MNYKFYVIVLVIVIMMLLVMKFGSFMTSNSKLNLIFDIEDGTFQKKINMRTWRTLQVICACPHICSWSTSICILHGTQKFHPIVKYKHRHYQISSGARVSLDYS